MFEFIFEISLLLLLSFLNPKMSFFIGKGGRGVGCFCSNLTVLSSTTDKIKRISNHFWDRWRHEYVVSLRETQRTSKLIIKR